MTELLTQNQGVIPPWTQGWRLQRSLAHAGMTTEDMADELGVARSTVSRWCNDKGRPTRGYLKLWAMRTGVELSWLTAEGENRPVSLVQTGIPAGLSVQPGHQVIDNDITRSRKRIRERIPLNPMLQLLKAVAA